MAYLVVVIETSLPIVVTLDAPRMIIDVVVHVELCQSLTGVRAFVKRVPGYAWRLGSFKVDPDKASGINLNMDGEESVLVLVKVFDFAESRCLG